ncbi:hypothetical protein [Arenibaculum sp.]|uniref:hypothetical protein n=1 Tax=Arenibaculum sp. TaxID=2865862 RepID=UPI002E12A7E0|nr:hypothetical protein [Arenibaculum sp.]
MEILFINAGDTFTHKASANAALYPNVGLLTIMSALKEKLEISGISAALGYIDGCVYGNEKIKSIISENRNTIKIVCFSVLTANYGASVEIAKFSKECIGGVTTIFGNDHFSALYRNVMSKQSDIDFGFYGNDVVMGFAEFACDVICNNVGDLSSYPGLVYRLTNNDVVRNAENPSEYNGLPLVKYSLCDETLPHSELYVDGQRRTYYFMKNRNLRSQIIDIGRGCIKFSGKRVNNIPVNACDFCGIIPGVKSVLSTSSDIAWKRIRNAFEHGYNYFYITADELPLTFWPLIKSMSQNVPKWFEELSAEQKPKMFGYARAEAFERQPEKIDILVGVFGFDHFFVGFDGLSDISLRLMNKQSVVKKEKEYGLMSANIDALNAISSRGCLITAGIVVTHLGITENIMQENYQNLEILVSENHKTFAALDFGPLCPIPGSQSFRYLVDPNFAQEKAKKYGLRVNYEYLNFTKEKYENCDLFDNNELIDDFMKGCCPDINQEILERYMEKISDLARRHGIVVGGGV